MTTIYDFTAQTIDGQPQALDAYRGQVLLIVNVASQCGFTPQYTGLEALYRKHKEEGFAVLGFPCDQFGHQEPGDEAEIKSFCSLHYDERTGLLGSEAIKWNFTKFLVDKQGNVVKRYAPQDKPESLEKDLEPLLQAR
jgi:glutathione peroxidase